MAKHFQSEMTKMMVKGQASFDKREAEDPRYSWMARKLSLLPKGTNSIILHVFNLNMFSTQTNCVSEFDDKDDEDDNED